MEGLRRIQVMVVLVDSILEQICGIVTVVGVIGIFGCPHQWIKICEVRPHLLVEQVAPSHDFSFPFFILFIILLFIVYSSIGLTKTCLSSGNYRGPGGYDPRSRSTGGAVAGDPRAAAAAGAAYGADAGRGGFPAGHPAASSGPLGRANPPASITVPPGMVAAGTNPNEQEKTKLIMQVRQVLNVSFLLVIEYHYYIEFEFDLF